MARNRNEWSALLEQNTKEKVYKTIALGNIVNLDLVAQAGYAFEAIENGNIDLLYTLLALNPEIINQVDFSGFNLVHRACRYVQYDCLELLIEKGANLNLNLDRKGTPLWFAVSLNRTLMVKLLLANNVDTSETMMGMTPLHNVKSAEITQLLLDAGADVKNINTETGMFQKDSVLHSVMYTEDFAETQKIIRVLIKAGANVNAINAKGETPLHIMVKTFQDKKIFIPSFNDLVKANVNWCIEAQFRYMTALDYAKLHNPGIVEYLLDFYKNYDEIQRNTRILNCGHFTFFPREIREKIVFHSSDDFIEASTKEHIVKSIFKKPGL